MVGVVAMEGWGNGGREVIVGSGGWASGRWDDSSCFRFFINFVFVGFLSVVRRVQGHVPRPSFDMIPRYGLAGMYPKS